MFHKMNLAFYPKQPTVLPNKPISGDPSAEQLRNNQSHECAWDQSGREQIRKQDNVKNAFRRTDRQCGDQLTQNPRSAEKALLDKKPELPAHKQLPSVPLNVT
jgi:hypothetical protein